MSLSIPRASLCQTLVLCPLLCTLGGSAKYNLGWTIPERMHYREPWVRLVTPKSGSDGSRINVGEICVDTEGQLEGSKQAGFGGLP